MAKLQYLLLLLSLGSDVLSQNSSIGAISSSASVVASSAGGASSAASSAASAALSLASVGSSSAAASESSIAASASSVASSLASVALSISSVASSIASSIASSSRASSTSVSSRIPISSTSPSSSSLSSSISTATETSSSVASTSSSSSSLPFSSSTSNLDSTTSETSTSTTASPSVYTTSSTFVSFSTSTIQSTTVIPTTSNGVVGYTTLTTYIVSSAPATTYISPYTETAAPSPNPTTQADANKAGGGGGLSSGAKIGIGVGVGLAVLAAATFGGWYSWYMRKRRRRSITASDRYPPSSIPSMSGMGGMMYQDKSDTRSELPSPPIGTTGQYSPPMRSPDRLIPVGGGVRSWNSVSNSGVPASSQSVSDYSERGGQPPPDAADAQPNTGYVPPGGAIHEMPENQQNQSQMSPQQQFSHNRTTSGESQPSELGEGTLPRGHQSMSSGSPPSQHQRTMSGGSQQYQSPSQGSDGYWQNTENAHELQGTPNYLKATTSRGEGYRGVDPEVPLHQRMQTERVPFRPGHLQKPPPGTNLPPSHNF